MTNVLRSNEALSHGYIQDHKAKRQESETIQQQIDEFFKRGGEIQKIAKRTNAQIRQELKR